MNDPLGNAFDSGVTALNLDPASVLNNLDALSVETVLAYVDVAKIGVEIAVEIADIATFAIPAAEAVLGVVARSWASSRG